jgi:uncharacterized Zn-finger protein
MSSFTLLADAVSALLRSRVVAGKDGSYLCLVCQTSLATVSSMRTHLRDLHVNVGKRFRCPVCGLLSSSATGLRLHMGRKHSKSNLRRLDYTQYEVMDDEIILHE